MLQASYFQVRLTLVSEQMWLGFLFSSFFFFFSCFVPVETKGEDRVPCAIFYSGVGDKC